MILLKLLVDNNVKEGAFMKLKSDALYFEINKSRTKPIGYIRNSYRENGKVKHQTISKIHGLTMGQLINMKAAFKRKNNKAR